MKKKRTKFRYKIKQFLDNWSIHQRNNCFYRSGNKWSRVRKEDPYSYIYFILGVALCIIIALPIRWILCWVVAKLNA